MNLRLLKEVSVTRKTVLLRIDMDVSLDSKGHIVDDARLRESLPTLRYLLKQKAKVVVIGHLGRPTKPTALLSTRKIAVRLTELLTKRKTHHVRRITYDVQRTTTSTPSPLTRHPLPLLHTAYSLLPTADILVFENLRFNEGEEGNRSVFAKQLASLADLYVNDAFASSHREHSSIVGVTKYLPSYAGLALEKEVKVLSSVHQPKHPFVVVLGGGKLDKLSLVESFTKKADAVLIGGRLMLPFLIAQKRMQDDSVQKSEVRSAVAILKKYTKKIVLPSDIRDTSGVVRNTYDGRLRTVDGRWQNTDCATGHRSPVTALDIGPHTIEHFSKILSHARTILWNGPLGKVEDKRFAKGTYSIARAIAKRNAYTLACGGDTLVVIDHLRLQNKFTHVSSGGGATLELLAKGTLLGLEVLEKK